ncbi:UNKNOWN [Stylonychia lemnae]|uniref:Uncharacterized protein n=1 Tax=Stylonychia lemnae TaxID=5949 RepID=A0A078B762_STYLE|nr:UNKNOWN [Stylonychia lemnae]|eukprot:CDW90350.1 UNKNOWN [Stylonychia lemnae]
MNSNPIFHSKIDKDYSDILINQSIDQSLENDQLLEFQELNQIDSASTSFPTIKIDDEDFFGVSSWWEQLLITQTNQSQNYDDTSYDLSKNKWFQVKVDQESNQNPKSFLKSLIEKEQQSQNTKIQPQDQSNPTNLTIQLPNEDNQSTQTQNGGISHSESDFEKTYQSDLSPSNSISSSRPKKLKFLKSSNKSTILSICRAFVKSLMINKSIYNINGVYQELVENQFVQDQIRRINTDLSYSTNPVENDRYRMKKIITKSRKLEKNNLEKLSILGKIRYRFSLKNIKNFLSDSVYNYLFRHFLLSLNEQNSQTFNQEVVSQMLNESNWLAEFQ